MTISYAVYDLATGEIRETRSTDRAESIDMNCPEGCSVYYGIANARLHRVVDGELVEKSDIYAQDELVLMIAAERARRLASGFDYDFGDARGVHRIGTSEADMRGWDDVTRLAGAMINAGVSDPIGIITDTGSAQVTAQEWQSVLIAAGRFGQPIWAASFALQAMDPIPQDIGNDIYWGGS